VVQCKEKEIKLRLGKERVHQERDTEKKKNEPGATVQSSFVPSLTI